MHILDRLLIQGWSDPVTGKQAPLPVSAIHVEEQLISTIDERIKQLGLAGSYIIVSDEITEEVAGKHIKRALGLETGIVLKQPLADDKTVAAVREHIKTSDLVIAVGSGTINDICKYAAFLEQKPYIVFGTALSMNGYSSANAAITVAGHKRSLAAKAPLAVWIDLDIIASSPKRLLRSGVGDMICRSTAQADWLLSHLLLGTFYTEEPFLWLSPYEGSFYEGINDLLKGDKELLRLLAHMLILSGLGMIYANGSYPASQGEHLIAHAVEMAPHLSLPSSYHGEQIAVTTCTMAALQSQMLEERPILKTLAIEEEGLKAFFGEEVATSCIKEYQQKQLSREQLDACNHLLEKHWNNMASSISKVMIKKEKISKILQAIGAPSMPEDIGWSRVEYQKAVAYAPYIRNRFSFLDIALLTGKMPYFLRALAASQNA